MPVEADSGPVTRTSFMLVCNIIRGGLVRTYSRSLRIMLRNDSRTETSETLPYRKFAHGLEPVSDSSQILVVSRTLFATMM